MIWLEAFEIAERNVAQLSPWCDRIEIAGSVRREKTEVGDIEIVCIPSTVEELGLFGAVSRVRVPEFAQTVRNLDGRGRLVKGDPETGKYMQVEYPDGLAVDIFTATPRNWGLIYAIRTGSAAYSHKVLARGWVKKGFRSADGMLTKGGEEREIREEKDLFDLIGIPMIEPRNREYKETA
jgi:DNA polymerase/3'-5' exonuclease PolX